MPKRGPLLHHIIRSKKKLEAAMLGRVYLRQKEKKIRGPYRTIEVANRKEEKVRSSREGRYAND